MSARPRARRAHPVRRRLLVAAGLAVAFAAGVGLGDALNDQPGNGSQTLIRTLEPLPLTAVPSETVTVTISNH